MNVDRDRSNQNSWSAMAKLDVMYRAGLLPLVPATTAMQLQMLPSKANRRKRYLRDMRNNRYMHQRRHLYTQDLVAYDIDNWVAYSYEPFRTLLSFVAGEQDTPTDIETTLDKIQEVFSSEILVNHVSSHHESLQKEYAATRPLTRIPRLYLDPNKLQSYRDRGWRERDIKADIDYFKNITKDNVVFAAFPIKETNRIRIIPVTSEFFRILANDLEQTHKDLKEIDRSQAEHQGQQDIAQKRREFDENFSRFKEYWWAILRSFY